jgi:Aspartyl protease
MEIGDIVKGFLREANNQVGGKGNLALLRVSIGNDPNWHPPSKDMPELAPAVFIGLIDTGANTSTIDSELAKELSLTVVGSVVASLTGKSALLPIVSAQVCLRAERYAAGLYILTSDIRAQQKIDVILGMDFLQPFDIHVSAKAIL